MSTLPNNVVTPTPVAAAANTVATQPAVTSVQAYNIQMQNSFAGSNLSLNNWDIHLMLAEIINFRQQLTVRQEFQSKNGWSDALNSFILENLSSLVGTLNLMTYKAPTVNVTGAMAQGLTAGGTTAESGAQASSNTATNVQPNQTVTQQTVLAPSSYSHPVVWDLSGNDVNIPQVSVKTIPNDFGRALITMLDRLFAELTRVDSRFQTFGLTPYESAMMMSLINSMFTLCQNYGGSSNQSPTPTGTLPSSEQFTYQGVTSTASPSTAKTS